MVNNSVLTPAYICPFLATSHWRSILASPPASARTDSVPTIVAKGNVRPEFLRIPQCSRFWREVLRSRTCSGVSRLLDGFARLRHRHRTQGEQHYYKNDREVVHVCSRGIGSSGESISPGPAEKRRPRTPPNKIRGPWVGRQRGWHRISAVGRPCPSPPRFSSPFPRTALPRPPSPTRPSKAAQALLRDRGHTGRHPTWSPPQQRAMGVSFGP